MRKARRDESESRGGRGAWETKRLRLKRKSQNFLELFLLLKMEMEWKVTEPVALRRKAEKDGRIVGETADKTKRAGVIQRSSSLS